MSVPRSVIDTAIVVCPQPDLPEARLLAVRVAGVPLFTRALLTAQQAGIQRFTVVASAPQQAALRGQLDGEARLRGRVRWLEPTEDPRAPSAYNLVLPVSVVLEAGALRGWLTRVGDSGSVTAPDAAGTSPLAVPAALLPECIQAALRGQPGLMRFLEKLQGDHRLVTIPWEGMRQQPVRSTAEVPAVERRMLAALRSPEDGPIVDRFVNRVLSVFLTRGLIRTQATPNQVTVASLVTGLAGAWLLGMEGAVLSLLGLALFQLSVILDHVDGEVARLKFQFSPLGKWLDNVSDHVVDLAVIALLTWRVAGVRTPGTFAVLGLAAAAGVTGGFVVVFWWSVSEQPRATRTTAPAQLVAPVLAFLANRDGFSLALWVTVLLGHPAWFLWALALGANAYWVAWLLIYGLPSRTPLAVERPAG